ncbi:MAG: hypothetical protein AAGG44_21505, partial [Planctomycetota bacterium]
MSVFFALGVVVQLSVHVACTDRLLAQQEADQPSVDVVRFGPEKRAADVDWRTDKLASYSGTIERMNAESLVILTKDGKRSVPSHRVESIVASWDPAARSAMQALEERRYEQAFQQLYAVLKGESGTQLPPWKQKLVIAAAVRAKWAIGDVRIAGLLFGRLVTNSSLPDLLYADLPLCWSAEIPGRALIATSKEWIVSEQPTLQLLGAS